MGIATAKVLLDGIIVGTVTVGDEAEVSPYPLGEGNAFGPAPSPDAFPQFASREFPGRSLGGGHGPSHAASHPPPHRRTLGHHPGEHHEPRERHLDPHNRTLTTESDKPKKFSTADVAEATHGKAEPTFPNIKHGDGGPDRSSIAKELEGNEPLTRRYAQMVVGEIYYDRASDRAKIVQAETAANRALKRGHSLEQALWLHGSGTDRLGGVGHGESGYYPASTMNRGMTEEQYQDFKTNILPKVLAGSDEAKGFTGNASADVAARQIKRGTPTMDLRDEGGDQYFDEDRGSTLPRTPSGTTSTGIDAIRKPQGVTRLGGVVASQANPRDSLEYLASRGGHSSVNRESKPVGATMGFDPELAARLHAAGIAYEHETGDKAKYGEGDRDNATQEFYWQDSNHGTRYPAAPPGRSEHQKGKAMDLPDSGFRQWLKKGNQQRFGLHFPVRDDEPHVQADPSFKGKFEGFNKAAPAKTAEVHGTAL